MQLTEDDGKHQRELQALFQRTQMMDEFGGELPALVTRLRTLQVEYSMSTPIRGSHGGCHRNCTNRPSSA